MQDKHYKSQLKTRLFRQAFNM